MTDFQYVPVRDVMVPSVETIEGLATVREAVDTMRSKDVSLLIVNRRDENDEYGLISISEIAKEVVEPNRSPDRTQVYEVMIKPVLSVDAGMNIRYAIRLLDRYGLNRALVVDHGRAVGVVTLWDMVFKYYEHH
jgi:CBS domain-containing protein